MKDVIIVDFYNRQKFCLTVKIKGQDSLISEIVNKWVRATPQLFPPSRLESNGIKKEPDIILYLDILHKKPKNFSAKKKLTIFFDSVKYTSSFSSRKKIFILYTKKGSFIKTDIKKKRAVGRIAKGEPLVFILLQTWLTQCIISHYCVNLHAGCITDDREGTSALFIGKNGTGKSTICSLLSRTKNFRTIHDDNISVHPLFKKISTICDNRNASNIFITYPNHLFFINKEKSLETRITSIRKKEAFKKIVFASEFPDNENEIMRKHRLDTLFRLVKQCRCYSLINGRELKENPDDFVKLLMPAIK